MKKPTVFFLTISLGFYFACSPTPTPQVTEKDKTSFDETAETAAIMKVIDGETDCFFKGDHACWASHWSHANYVFQGWNNDDGTAHAAIGWDKINAQGKGWIEKYYKNGEVVIHPTVKREKPLVKFFNDKTAYLIWKQYNSDSENTFYRTSQETRIMEKLEDEWKIVNVSALWDTETRIPFDSLQMM